MAVDNITRTAKICLEAHSSTNMLTVNQMSKNPKKTTRNPSIPKTLESTMTSSSLSLKIEQTTVEKEKSKDSTKIYESHSRGCPCEICKANTLRQN